MQCQLISQHCALVTTLVGAFHIQVCRIEPMGGTARTWRRWQIPLLSTVWVCLKGSSALPPPSRAQLPSPLLNRGQSVPTASPVLRLLPI